MTTTGMFDRLVNIRRECGQSHYHLVDDDVEPALTALNDSELQVFFDEMESRLGCEFAHLRQRFVSRDDTDWIVTEAWCEGGENHTSRIKAMFELHERADEILRDRGLDPYR